MKKFMTKKHVLISNVIMTCILICTLFLGSFAYWGTKDGDVNIPTHEFNATEEEFSYYACVPNLAANTGYDYYDIDYIPDDLTDKVTGLACVRFEALTSTAYIPAFPEIQMNGKKYNANGNQDLPVIHFLNSVQINDSTVDNGFLNIENLIIPDTITYIQPGSFTTSKNLKEVSFLGNAESGNVFFDSKELANVDVRYQHANRNILYRLTAQDKSKIKLMQFNDMHGELEFEYETKKFVNWILPNEEITSLTVEKVDRNPTIAPNAPKLGAPQVVETKTTTFAKPLLPGYVYKISYDRNTGKIQADKYSYKAEVHSNGVVTPYDLTMRIEQGYEYYEIDNSITCNTITIPDSKATIDVFEYINDVKPAEPDSTFDIQYLQADYNKDNDVYHIRYSPINVYVSRHFYTENGELKNKLTPQQIAVEKAYFLNKVKQELEPGPNGKKILKQVDQPKLMLRNYSNEEFEEYIYYDYTGTNSITGDFIVSNISNQNVYFGGTSHTPCIGVINESSPLGELHLENQNLVLFTPNKTKNYEERYFGLFDEYDNLLETLDFNIESSLANGFQAFDATVPLALNDYKKFVVKEVDKEGNIKNNTPLYSSNVTDIVDTQQVGDNSNAFAPYFLGEKSNLNSFVRNKIDANGNFYYLFENVYIDATKPYFITEHSSDNKVVLKNDMDLPFQVIDGFFYSKEYVTLIGPRNDQFKLVKSGYYDLMIREREYNGVKNRFIGASYKGQEPRARNNNYLEQWDGNTMVQRIEMTRTNNYFMSYVDFFTNDPTNKCTYKVIDTYGTKIHSFSIQTEHFHDGLQRLYFADQYFLNQKSETDTTLVKTRHAVINLNQVHLTFSFGNPPQLVTGTSTYDEDNPFNKLIRSSGEDEFILSIQGNQKQVMPQAQNREGLYVGYIVVTDVNPKITIDITKGQTNIVSGSVPFPGVYKITYNSSNNTVEYVKIQKPRYYNIELDDHVVNALIANTEVSKQEVTPTTEIGPDKYLEFKSPRLINVNEEVQLDPKVTPHNVLLVTDNNGNTIKEIESVTLDGVKTTVIPRGTYEFYYSIDSTRRVGDKYHVFTYFRLVSRDTAGVTYHYPTSETSGNTETYYRQMNAVDGTKLVDYSLLPGNPFLATDYNLIGWTNKDGTITYKPNQLVKLNNGDNIDLYPVFKQNDHAYVELSEHNFDSSGPLQFSVNNIGTGQIQSIDIGDNMLPAGFVNKKDELIGKYIHVENNVVTIDVALCEIIGYKTDGQLFVVNVLNLDGSTYKINTYLPYPDFTYIGQSK